MWFGSRHEQAENRSQGELTRQGDWQALRTLGFSLLCATAQYTFLHSQFLDSTKVLRRWYCSPIPGHRLCG